MSKERKDDTHSISIKLRGKRFEFGWLSRDQGQESVMLIMENGWCLRIFTPEAGKLGFSLSKHFILKQSHAMPPEEETGEANE